MSHQFDDWYNTPNEKLSVGRADGRTMEYTFFGVWKSVGVGSTPPQTATAAIAFAEASPNLANLRVDGEFVPPTSTSTPSTITAPPAGYILASMTVEDCRRRISRRILCGCTVVDLSMPTWSAQTNRS